ncbi:MAG: HAD family hydrolase [Vulcanimicrobiaceae bacterium]
MEGYALGFDFDHTLGVDNLLERTVALELLAEYARERGAAYDSADAGRAVDAALERTRTGGVPIEAALAGFFDLFVPASVGETGFDAASDFRERALARAPDFVRPLPGLATLFAWLDRVRIPRALLTNGWSPLQEEKARLIAFAGPVLVSERIGARKPAREAFAHLVELLRMPPERIYYVGDDPLLDCAGAREAGLRAVWFDRGERPFPPDLPSPDLIVRALEELPDALQGHATQAANRAG